jgi:DNA-binding CsgD family transcriptional regulator
MVAEIAGAPAVPGLLAAAAGAGGNPLFVTELVRALLAQGGVARDAPDGAVLTLPARLRLTILGRLSGLSAATLQLLRSAAVLGSRFRIQELATVTGRAAFDLTAAVQEAFGHRVLVDDGTWLRFRHDLIREAVYEDSPPSVRRALHREAARRLAAAGVGALRVAEVLADAAEPGDDDAVTWLSGAARDAAETSPGIAVELLDRALALAAPAAPGRDGMLLERAELLLWAGRLPEAEAGCRSLLDRADDAVTGGSAHFVLARCLLAQGRMRECLRHLGTVSRSPAATARQRAEALAWAAVAHLSLGELGDAAATADQARLAAEPLADDTTLSLALTASAGVLDLRSRPAEALRVADRGIQHADRSPVRQGHRYPHHLDKACLLIGLDRFDAARAGVETGMRVSEQLGMPWQLAAYHTVRAVELFSTGAWDDALDAWHQGQELAADDTGVLGTAVVGHSVVSLIAAHRNDLEAARRSVSPAVAVRAAEDSYARYLGHWAATAQARVLEAGGAVPEAVSTLAAAWKECSAAGISAAYPVLGPDLVRLAVAAGDRDRAEQVTAAVTAVADASAVASVTAAALLCQGLRDDDPETLSRAADRYAQVGRPLEVGLAREQAGAAYARVRDADAATASLKRALAAYERLDAARDVARTLRRLRGLGVRPGRRGSRRRPRTGWDSLTETERTVVDLVAEGLSNPQIGDRLFVSRRTVQTHLAHVFQKLQLSSRSELAAAVTRHRGIG